MNNSTPPGGRPEGVAWAVACRVPTLPHTAARALRVARDPHASLSDVARLMAADVGLAASALRLANGAIFGGAGKVASLDAALGRLGLRRGRDLILAAGLRSLAERGDEFTRARCSALLGHALVTARLCHRLGQCPLLKPTGEEFVAGLLHDVGRVLLTLAVGREHAAADPLDFRHDGVSVHRERKVLGTDHCRVGASFAQANRLPDGVIAAVALHHHPVTSHDHRPLVGIVAAADHMANHLQAAGSAADYRPEGNRGIAALASGRPRADWDALCRAAVAAMEEVLAGGGDWGEAAP